MQGQWKSVLNLIFKLLLAVFIIYWLVASGRFHFKGLATLLRWQYLIPCMACVGINIFLSGERWRRLLLAQKIQMPVAATLKITLIGTFFNYIMPGGVGGDLIRGFYMAKMNEHAKTGAAISVLVDRLVGLYIMILMAIVAMLFYKQTFEQKELKIIFFFLFAAAILFSFFWAILFSKKNHQKQWIQSSKFSKLYNSFICYQQHKKYFLEAMILSLVAQVISFYFFIFAGHGLGYTDIPVSVYFFVLPLGFILIAIPISIAGIGVGQAAFLFLFDLALSQKSQIGPMVITAYQIAVFLFGLLGAYFYISLKNVNKT